MWTTSAPKHVRSNRKNTPKKSRSEVSCTFRSEVSGHFGPRSEVSIGHSGPRSEILRHFGPNFLGPKCPRSEVSGHPYFIATHCACFNRLRNQCCCQYWWWYFALDKQFQFNYCSVYHGSYRLGKTGKSRNLSGQGKVRGNIFLEKSGKMKNWCQQMSYFQAKMHQFRFLLGLCSRPCWGSLLHSLRPPSCI